MKAAALSSLCLALVFAGQASAQNFCSVTNGGRENCRFYTLQSCQDQVRSLGGFCVYRSSDATSGNGNDRAYADVIGNFRRGEAGAAQRRQDQTYATPAPTTHDGTFGRPQPGWYPEQRVDACEYLRFAANSAYARPDATFDERADALDAWSQCLGPK